MNKNKINSEPLLYRVIKPLAVGLFRAVFRPKISGSENIPKKGAVVLAGNHIKFWDCFMVMASTNRCVHFLAKAELFSNFFTNWFFKTAGIIPVHRNRKDKAALEDAEKYLFNNCVIGIFPEGTTNKTAEQILPFKIGAVKMAADTKSPIIPFVIRGKYIPFRSSIEIKFNKHFFIESDDLSSENERLKDVVCSNLKF